MFKKDIIDKDELHVKLFNKCNVYRHLYYPNRNLDTVWTCKSHASMAIQGKRIQTVPHTQKN